MPTITLSANRINQMPLQLTSVSNTVKGYKSDLETLRSRLLTIDSSVCNLDEVIYSVRASSQIQETKIECIETLNQNIGEFVADVVRIDGDAAEAINQSRDDFYDKYYYLKPECEKSGWEKFKDGCKKVCEWCKGHWDNLVYSLKKIINYLAAYFIDWIGRRLHTLPAALLIMGLVFAARHLIDIGKIWTKNGWPGTDWFLGLTLGAVADTQYEGVYHIKQNWWQSWGPIGYNNGYDTVFYAAIIATGNTMARKKSVSFDVDLDGDGRTDKTYLFWSWKGDYMNLGAGAETGIYEYYSDTHWLTATDRATVMELDLYYMDQEDPLFHYAPYSEEETELWNNGKQWWITGFDSHVQNVRAEDIRTVTTIDFSEMEDGEKIYEAFKEAVESAKATYGETDETAGWSFPENSYTAVLDWKAEDWE